MQQIPRKIGTTHQLLSRNRETQVSHESFKQTEEAPVNSDQLISSEFVINAIAN